MMDEEQVRAKLKEVEWVKGRENQLDINDTFSYGKYCAFKEVLEGKGEGPKPWVCLSAKKEFLGWVMGKDLSEATNHLMYGEMGFNIYGEPVVYLVEPPAGDPVKVK